MKTAHNYKNQRQAIIGTITALMTDLQKLAPHPDQPKNKGPLFLKGNTNFKVANDHDGVLGSMMLEGMLGTAFSEAISEHLGSEAAEICDSIDLSNTMECYSAYITEVEEDKEKVAAHGQGTMARMSGKSIAGSFNMRSTISAGMQAFMDDLPQRMKIEKDLAYYAKQLEMIDAAPVHTPQRPRFAA